MEAAPVGDRPGMLVVLGQSEAEIGQLNCYGTKLKVVRYGPNLEYHGLGLSVPSSTFSIGDQHQGKSLFIGDIRHTFYPHEWVLIHYKGEVNYNPRFACPQCSQPSGVVRSIKPGEDNDEHLLECQECSERWLAPIVPRAS